MIFINKKFNSKVRKISVNMGHENIIYALKFVKWITLSFHFNSTTFLTCWNRSHTTLLLWINWTKFKVQVSFSRIQLTLDIKWSDYKILTVSDFAKLGSETLLKKGFFLFGSLIQRFKVRVNL